MEFLDDYCAIIEYKKDQFHKTRVAIWSFIQNNQWFDGKIIILSLSGYDLKPEDQAHLDQIYDNIELIKVDKNYHDIVKQKINKKSTGVDHSLDYAGLYALKIKSKGNLYFSSSIIFNRDVTSFLSIESAVFARKSGRLPAGSGDELNPSMFYIPGEHCSDRLFNLSLNYLKNHNNIFSSDSRAEIITLALREFKISIDVVDMVNLVDSSSFPDTKYRDFLRHSKAICAINMNTIDLSDPRFMRINLYWQQINRQSIDYKPSTIKINKIKANSKAPKHLEVGRHKTSLPKDVIQLDLESEFSKIEVRKSNEVRLDAPSKINPKITPKLTDASDISVIIPAYRADRFIKECLDSIVNQAHQCEILIGVDNCDETIAKLNQIRDEYPNLKIYRTDNSVGPYVIRNSLARVSSRANLLFFDADDIMRTGMISTIQSINNGAQPVRFKYTNFRDGSDPAQSADRNTYVAHGVFFIPKETFMKVGGFQAWTCGADTEFMKRCEMNGIKSLNLNLDLFYRRIHNSSLTQSPGTNYRSPERRKISIWIKTNRSWNIPINAQTTEIHLI